MRLFLWATIWRPARIVTMLLLLAWVLVAWVLEGFPEQILEILRPRHLPMTVPSQCDGFGLSLGERGSIIGGDLLFRWK